MHARYSSKRTQLVIVCSVFWLAIMLALTLTDYTTRSHETQPGVSHLARPAASHLFRVWTFSLFCSQIPRFSSSSTPTPRSSMSS